MSDNREVFRDTAQQVLADTLSRADIEAAERRIPPRALFGALRDTGVTMMLAPEDRGGVAASLPDALAILRAAGAAAAPGPLLETMLGQRLLAQASLPPVDGALALVFVDHVDGPEVGASRWRSPPTLRAVPWGGLAERLLIVQRGGDGGARLVVAAPCDWTVAAGVDAAGEPRDTLSAEAPPVTTADLPGLSYDEALRAAAVLRAGQIVGAIEWSFERSVQYATERRQFGRELGRFQAVQQMLAELADHTLAASAITEAAAEGFSGALVAAARSRLGDAADLAISISHQVHGAIGFSREYALNYRTRRLMAWRDDYGDVLFWRRSLAMGFIGATRESFWPAVADAGLSKRA
jgi:acyl-CoA dehydrogenase